MKKTKDFFKEYAEFFVFSILFMLLNFYKERLFFGLMGKAAEEHIGYLSVSYVFFPLFFIGLGLLLWKKKSVFFLLGVDVFTSILVAANCIYYTYYRAPLTLRLLHQAGTLNKGNMNASIIACVKWEYFVPLMLSILCIGLVFIFRKILKYPELQIAKGIAVRLPGLAILIACVGMITWNICAEEQVLQLPKETIIKRLGLHVYHIYDAIDVASTEYIASSITNEERASIEEFYKKEQEPNKYFGVDEGKNLVVVQLEAFQSFVLGMKWNGQEVTPNLNKLIKDQIYFDDLYYQTSLGNTSDAEFLFHTGILPLNDAAVSFTNSTNTLPTFEKELKKKGYSLDAFHGFTGSYWNREVMYNQYGFDEFHSKEDMSQEDIIGWGVSDKGLFTKSIEMMKKQKEKIYQFLVTLSVHHPYNALQDWSFDKGELDGTMLGDYLQSINYIDKCIGDYIQELKDNDLYKDTVLALYGDHTAITGEMYSQVVKLFDGLESEEISNLHMLKYSTVPGIIINSEAAKIGVSKEFMQQACGQVDLMPTIANLMGVKQDFGVGRDLLSECDKPYAVFKSGYVATDEHYLVDDVLYNRSDFSSIEDEGILSELKALRKQNDISQLIVKYDYFNLD